MKSPINDKSPLIDDTSYIAPNATVLGDVAVGANSGIWFGAIVRGDVNSIRIGSRTNIQDLCVLHVDRENSLDVGDDTSIGHRAILHGCSVGNKVLVGMGAIIMNGSAVGDESVVAAGALVTEGTIIPRRSLVIGLPAKVKRELSEDEVAAISKNAMNYVGYAEAYVKAHKK